MTYVISSESDVVPRCNHGTPRTRTAGAAPSGRHNGRSQPTGKYCNQSRFSHITIIHIICMTTLLFTLQENHAFMLYIIFYVIQKV